jgi:hypothetical protein
MKTFSGYLLKARKFPPIISKSQASAAAKSIIALLGLGFKTKSGTLAFRMLSEAVARLAKKLGHDDPDAQKLTAHMVAEELEP